MKKVFKILIAIVAISLISFGLLALAGNHRVKERNKQLLAEISKNGVNFDEMNEKFSKENKTNIGAFIFKIADSNTEGGDWRFVGKNEDQTKIKESFKTESTKDKTVYLDINGAYVIMDAMQNFNDFCYPDMKRQFKVPGLSLAEKIGAWFNSELLIVQLEKLANFFENDWKKITGNKENVVLFTDKKMTIYKKDDYVKYAKEESSIPQELKFESKYHPYVLLVAWGTLYIIKKTTYH